MRPRVTEQRECPFCNREITIRETTTAQQEEAGLVYLAARCVPCEARIDAAGIGQVDALKDMDDRISRRIGTRPESYRIKIRPERKRRRKR